MVRVDRHQKVLMLGDWDPAEFVDRNMLIKLIGYLSCEGLHNDGWDVLNFKNYYHHSKAALLIDHRPRKNAVLKE